MAITNCVGLIIIPFRSFYSFLHHSNRTLLSLFSPLVKQPSTPLDETLQSLHPYTIMPYDSPLSHIMKVAYHTSDVFYHYHFISNKNVITSVETRLMRTIHAKIQILQSELDSLQTSVEEGLKQYPPVTSGLLSQKDQCITSSFGQYSYSLCILGEAKQDSTKLGSWSLDVNRDYAKNRTVEYTGGATCWNGIQRKLVVDFECGAQEEITSLSEPSTCQYHAVMKSPCFCTDEYLEGVKRRME